MKATIPNRILLILLMATGPFRAQEKGDAVSLDRETMIQKTLTLRASGQYDDAIKSVDTLLAQWPKDGQLLLLKGDIQLEKKAFHHAVGTLERLIALDYEATVSKINLSYALFMDHKPRKALAYAKDAWDNDPKDRRAVINYFNAMLWNVKTKEAEVFLKAHDSMLGPDGQLVLTARLKQTAGKTRQAMTYYDSLVNQYPNKDYLFEYAEVLIGNDETARTQKVLDKGSELLLEPQTTALTQKLEAKRQAQIGYQTDYFKDKGDNVRWDNAIWWQQGGSPVYRVKMILGHSDYSTENGATTKSVFGVLHMEERWNTVWSGNSELRLEDIRFTPGGKYTSLEAEQYVQYQPNKRVTLGGKFASSVLDYTAELLGKNIRTNEFGYLAHLMVGGRDGFYSQGGWAVQSDDNQRFQAFGSVYHVFRFEPTFKLGLNTSYLHYEFDNGAHYFSPDRYFNTEIFTDFVSISQQKFHYSLQAAAGIQQIEHNSLEPSYRFQSELGFRLKHLDTFLKYRYSNVAASNGSGYRYNWFTAGLLWKW